MYLYFDEHGVLKEIINDTAIRQGDINVNKVYCYFENTAIIGGTANIRFSDNTEINGLQLTAEQHTMPVPYDPNRDLQYFRYYQNYQFYSFILGYYDSDTQYPLVDGLCKMTIFGTISGNVIKAQGMVVFNIESSVVQADTNITQAEFEYLANLLQSKEDKINKTSSAGDSEILYASQKLVKLVNISGKTYSETLDFLADVKMPYYYSNGRMYLYKTHDVDWNLYFTSFDVIANKIYIAIFTENIGPQDVGIALNGEPSVLILIKTHECN